MVIITFLKLIFVLISTQQVLGKPVESSENDIKATLDQLRLNGSATDKLLLLTVDNFNNISELYVSEAINATQYLLRDDDLKSHTKPEALMFKFKLCSFLNNYAKSKSMEEIYIAMIDFVNITHYYFELTDQQITEDSKFIINLLNKYNCKDITTQLFEYFEKFFADFIKKFEENKKDVPKPILDWFVKFLNLSNLKERIDSIIEFTKLAYQY